MAARKASIGRVPSLDAVRGLAVLLVVAWLAGRAPEAPWPLGFTVEPASLVAPTFAFVAGCAYGLAQFREWLTPARTARRVVILAVVGLVLANDVPRALTTVQASGFDPATLVLTGPLQQMAALLLLLALAGTWARAWAGWLVTTICLAVALSIALYVVQLTCQEQRLTSLCNPSAAIDLPLLWGHAGGAGILADPFGIPATIGLAVAAYAGAALTHGLVRARSTTRRQSARVVGIALANAAILGAFALGSYGGPTVVGGQPLEPIPVLATPPLTLAVASNLSALAAALHPLLDRDLRGQPTSLGRLAVPLARLGRIAFLAIAASTLVHQGLGVLPEPRASAQAWIASSGDVVRTIAQLVAVGAWLWIAWWLDRRGTRLRQ